MSDSHACAHISDGLILGEREKKKEEEGAAKGWGAQA